MSDPSFVSATPPARYFDHYGMLSYADFLTHEAAGTLAGYAISARSDQGDAA